MDFQKIRAALSLIAAWQSNSNKATILNHFLNSKSLNEKFISLLVSYGLGELAELLSDLATERGVMPLTLLQDPDIVDMLQDIKKLIN